MHWADFWLGMMAGAVLNYVVYELLKWLAGIDK